jgi:hypothetical protein
MKFGIIGLLVVVLVVGMLAIQATVKTEVYCRIGSITSDPIQLYGFKILGKTELRKSGRVFYSLDLENVLPGSRRMILSDIPATEWMYEHVEIGKSYLKLKNLPPADPNSKERTQCSLFFFIWQKC